jgi:hypothetical protein
MHVTVAEAAALKAKTKFNKTTNPKIRKYHFFKHFCVICAQTDNLI